MTSWKVIIHFRGDYPYQATVSAQNEQDAYAEALKMARRDQRTKTVINYDVRRS